MKLLLGEPGSDTMVSLRDSAERVACVAIGYVELRAGLAQAKRTGRVAGEEYATVVAGLTQLWAAIAEVPLDQRLLIEAGNAAETHALRSYDAVHLAALQTAGPPGTIAFACWDRELRHAAGQLGYELLPRTL